MPNAIHSPAALQTPADISVALVGGFAHLKLPIGFALADAAVLYTIPAGLKLSCQDWWWEITTSWTGGASSAIGISSTNVDYNTKGDLLGGATGDVLATLVSTGRIHKGGTIGAKFASNGKAVLVGGDVIRFDRITSAFTAGAGFVHVNCRTMD